MKSFVLVVAIMFMPFTANAHQSENEQAKCHKNAEGVLHCHVSGGLCCIPLTLSENS